MRNSLRLLSFLILAFRVRGFTTLRSFRVALQRKLLRQNLFLCEIIIVEECVYFPFFLGCVFSRMCCIVLFVSVEYAGHIGDDSNSEIAEIERRRLLSLVDRF